MKDNFAAYNFLNAGGLMYFAGSENNIGYELWKTDGTVDGTSMVKDINAGVNASNPYMLTAVNNELLFSANDGIHGTEVWQSDGTASGTSMVKDINQVTTSGSNPYGLRAFNNGIIFTAYQGNGSYGQKLWKSDGTGNGTVSINDTVYNQDYLNTGVSINNVVYFWGNSISGRDGLYKTDGSPGGITLVKDFTDVPNTYYGIAATASLVYFYLYNYSTASNELWRSDGTDANTYLIKNDFNYIYNTTFISVGDAMYFAYSGSLWKSDGTIDGTVMVKSFNADPSSLTVQNGLLFFSAYDGSTYNLWKSDRTSAGTVKVSDNITNPNNLFASNNALFFTATGNPAVYGNIGTELFKTDGTSNGTVLVKNIHPGGNGTSIYLPTNVDSTLYFFTNGSTNYTFELWKSNGTPGSTYRVSSVGNGDGTAPYSMVASNGKLFFAINNKIWQSDGIKAGTHIVADNIFEGMTIYNSNVNLTATNNQLFLLPAIINTGRNSMPETSVQL